MKIKYIKLAQWLNPQDVFATLYNNEKHAFWFDRKTDGKQLTYIGNTEEVITYSLKTKETVITKGTNKQTLNRDIFTFLDTELSGKKITSDPELPFDFTGGYVGYFGYELKALTQGVKKYVSKYPDSLWFFVTRFLVFDNKKNCIYLAALENEKNEVQEWFAKIEKKLNENREPYRKTQSAKKTEISFSTNLPKKKYLQAITKAKKYMQQGESYEICLTNTFSTNAEINSYDLFNTIRTNNPSPYLTYFRHYDLAIICSTPEQFLTIDSDNTIISKPIKGTIARGKTQDEDMQQKKKLLSSEKDLAENLMITDLLRNDLGKICEIGSVTVPKLHVIETYETVHQMVSTVQGKLRDEVSIIESIKTCFPGGSMTGAPKIRTMKILDELETQARGIYSGAIGYLSLDQTASLNIVIRTIIVNGTDISVGAGGAILYQSDEENEYEEMLLKARVLLQSIAETVNAESFKISDETSHKVSLALGANVGDKKKNITLAIRKLRDKLSDITVAQFYESKPMYFEEQDVFINTVIVGCTTLTPDALLKFCKEIEASVGRKKTV